MSLTTMLARALSALLLFVCADALAVNDAVFVSQSVPASMAPGGAYNVAVTMKNTGSATWPAGTAYLLGSQNPPDNTLWGGARAAFSGSVAPGGLVTFSFQVTAPATPGTYGFQWRMVQEYVEWFGALTPNVAVTVAPPLRNDAQVISQTAPSPMTAGKSYTASVTLKNIGATTWNSADGYTLGAQNPQDNRLWNGGRVALGATVAPGQQYTFSFPVTAPAPGSYSMQWKMLRENVEWFGATSSAPVTVAGAPGGDVITYIHTDGLGSPVARTDAAANLLSRTLYEPYGATAGGVAPTIGFTGHVNDADTGLVYMQQRYYDPVAARFLSIDPVTSDANTGGSFNRYAYANNSPFRYIDPDGRGPTLSDFQILTPEKAERAAQYWADRQVETGNGLYAIPGAAAALFAKHGEDLILAAGSIRGVRANNLAGAEFQSKVASRIKSTNVQVAEEVTIKTASGVKTRMDIVSRDDHGNIACTECKASATAPLTKNQATAHPEIGDSGGVVVGKGKPGFPGGTVIPPQKVDVVRP